VEKDGAIFHVPFVLVCFVKLIWQFPSFHHFLPIRHQSIVLMYIGVGLLFGFYLFVERRGRDLKFNPM